MFPFDLSFQDIFLFGVVLTVAGGYKEPFLKYSRQGGLFVGRAVGFIRQKRDQVFTSTAQKEEMEALQQQLSDAMAQMQYIRHDIRSSTRISRAYMSQPGDREVPVDAAGQGTAAAQSTDHRRADDQRNASLPFRANDPLSSPDTSTVHISGPSIVNQWSNEDAQTSSMAKADSNSANDTTWSRQEDGAAPRLPASRNPDNERREAVLGVIADGPASLSGGTAAATPAGAGVMTGVKSARERFDSIDLGGQDGKVVYIDGVPLIPVSAADTGKLPERKGPITGSDIMEEALLEARVAREASAIIRGQPNER
eukprot:jgi/Ulvmu1/937/UM102_0020.1